MLSVITPASDRRLTTLATARAELGSAVGGDDDYVATLIDQASAAVATWCDRVFGVETVKETMFDGVGWPMLSLSRWPVICVDSLTLNGTVADPSSYVLDPDKGFVFALNGDSRGCRFARGPMVIQYRTGYVLPNSTNPTLPADLQRAAILMVKEAWFARGRDPVIKTDEVAGVGSTSYWVGGLNAGGLLPSDVEGLLTKYRQPVIG